MCMHKKLREVVEQQEAGFPASCVPDSCMAGMSIKPVLNICWYTRHIYQEELPSVVTIVERDVFIVVMHCMQGAVLK